MSKKFPQELQDIVIAKLGEVEDAIREYGFGHSMIAVAADPNHQGGNVFLQGGACLGCAITALVDMAEDLGKGEQHTKFHVHDHTDVLKRIRSRGN